MEFRSYELDQSIYDEMFLPDGAPREHCRRLFGALTRLSSDELGSIQDRVTRSFSDEGITFTVYGDDEADERIMPIDCLPRLMSATEWRGLAKGLTQRFRALNIFLGDVYGESRIIRDSLIPADLVKGCPHFRTEMRGLSAPHGTWVGICGTDLVRTNDGFKVLEDNLRVPSGVSYMLANRKAAKVCFGRLYRLSRVLEVEGYGRALLETIRELAPNGRPDPVIALLTPGVYNSAFYEHVFLAHEIGAELVEGRDLLVRDGFVYMRTTTGLRRVDVVYRRVDDDFIDPLVFRPDSLLGVPGLTAACRAGNVTLVNAPGTGVADDKSVYAYVPDMIRYYLGEEPLPGERRHLPLQAALGPRVPPGQPAGPGRQAGGRVRGVRDADRPRLDAQGTGGVRPPGAGRPGELHFAARSCAVPVALPDRRRVRAAARRPPAPLCCRDSSPALCRERFAGLPCDGAAL